MLVLDVSHGASGDMLVSALAGLGADRKRVIDALDGISAVTFRDVEKSGIEAVGFESDYSSEKELYVRLVEVIKGIGLGSEVEYLALSILERLALAEAKAHDVPVDLVHLHEASDCVVDAVAFSVALDDLGLLGEPVYATPCGVSAIASATKIIIEESRIPIIPLSGIEFISGHVHEHDADGVNPHGHGHNHASICQANTHSPELLTPTGAAILSVLSPRTCPQELFEYEGRVGVGSGSMDLDWPNILRAMLPDAVYLLESNLDDCTGEEIGHAMQVLMAEGALDVSTTPLFMKKGRPGYQIQVLTRRPREHSTALMRETGTLGVREHLVSRRVLERECVEDEVNVSGVSEKINYKKTKYTWKPEYEDLKKASEKHGVPVKKIREDK